MAGAVTTPEAILAALDEQQRAAAEALHGPVCILAGAGTGKTRAITHRIAYGVATGAYDPARVLAITFTNRAAGELRSRLHRLGAEGVTARTVHAAALAQLGYFWPRVLGTRPPTIIDHKLRTIADALSMLGYSADTATMRDLAGEIEWRKSRVMTIDQYSSRAHVRAMPGNWGVDRVVELHTAYERLKDDRRQIDFEDVLLACAGMITDQPSVAIAVRDKYRHFVVDEYQDVSPLQQAVLAAWLGGRDDVCVVGDPNQTIYSFAGANRDSLQQFRRDFEDATVVELHRSYRSSGAILATANALMRGRSDTVLTATRPAGPAVERLVAEGDAAEGAAVVSRIRTLLDGGAAARDIAILTRFHAQSGPFEHALASAGISVAVRGQQRFFDMPAVKRMMPAMRTAPTDSRPLFQQVVDLATQAGWSSVPPQTHGAERAQWDALNTLVTMAEESDQTMTLAAFGAHLAQRAAHDHAPEPDAVTISTIHAAKGLEWRHVFVIGMAEGLLPISYATSLEQIDEERRLAYVAITRAAETLTLSYARAAGRTQREPSRFLAEAMPPAARAARASGR